MTTSVLLYFHESRRASIHYSRIANKEQHSCIFWMVQPDSAQRQGGVCRRAQEIPPRCHLLSAAGTLASSVMTSKSCTALPTLLQTELKWRLYNLKHWNARKAIAILATLCEGKTVPRVGCFTAFWFTELCWGGKFSPAVHRLIKHMCSGGQSCSFLWQWACQQRKSEEILLK